MSFEDAKKENIVTSIETKATERERRIRQFLAESLPPTEERIQEPMNPQCEVCVVLPAYSERNYILRPIASLAKQKGVDFNQFELIFVVNNPPNMPKREESQTENDYKKRVELYNKGIGDNQETLKLIRYIRGENVEVVLSEQEKETVVAIQKSGLRLFAIDKASEGKTLPQTEANVGGARNRGVAEAVERFHNQIGRNGIIVQADAEVRFSESYIKDVINIFKEKPELVGIAGGVEFDDSPEDYSLFRKLFSDSGVKQIYIEVASLILGQIELGEEDHLPAFCGSNMASKAFEAAIVGGVPKLSGAEDPAFGFRLAQIGKTEEIFSLKTTSIHRFSPRTTTGFGQKNIEFVEGIKGEGRIFVESPEEIETTEKMRNELIKAIDTHQTTPEQLRIISRVHGQALFSDEQLHLISQKIQKLQGMTGNEMLLTLGRDKDIAGLFKNVRAQISEIIKPIPLEEAIAKLVEIFCTNAFKKEKYEYIREQMIKEENDSIKRKKEILHSLVDIFFENKSANINISILMDIIKSQKENLGISDEEIKYLEDRDIVLSIILEAIVRTKTKQQAVEILMSEFKDSIGSLAENPLRLKMIELEAIREVAEEKENESIKERFNEFLGMLSSNGEKVDRLIDLVSKGLDNKILRQLGLSSTVQEINRALGACITIENQEKFFEAVSDILSPIIDVIDRHPQLSSEIKKRLEGMFQQYRFTPINESLSYGIGGDNLHIHLADISNLNYDEKVASARDGLEKLAVIIKNNPKIKTISATSWFVARHPRLMQKLGFKIEGPISEEMRQKYFKGEEHPISSSIISREELLLKYSKE